MTISAAFQWDLLWWGYNARTMQANILLPQPDLSIFIDASTLGYALYMLSTNTMAGSHWSSSEAVYRNDQCVGIEDY
jgi:hypothetical protein